MNDQALTPTDAELAVCQAKADVQYALYLLEQGNTDRAMAALLRLSYLLRAVSPDAE